MKKQTVVEWLLQAIEGKNGTEFSSYYLEFIDQAKAMETEQIEDAWHDGFRFDSKYKNFKEYYNETYGGDK